MILKLKCSCGKVRGLAKNMDPEKTLRCVCYCDDCQSYAHYLSRPKEILDSWGGTDICPVRPSDLKITEGLEHVSGMRLSEQGMYRWFADCCNTPIANLQPLKKMPYAGVPVMCIDIEANGKTVDELIGPVQYRMQAKFAHGKPPGESSAGAPLGFILRVIPYALGGFLRGQYSPTPFSDATTLEPTRPFDVISPEFRARLRAHTS